MKGSTGIVMMRAREVIEGTDMIEATVEGGEGTIMKGEIEERGIAVIDMTEGITMTIEEMEVTEEVIGTIDKRAIVEITDRMRGMTGTTGLRVGRKRRRKSAHCQNLTGGSLVKVCELSQTEIMNLLEGVKQLALHQMMVAYLKEEIEEEERVRSLVSNMWQSSRILMRSLIWLIRMLRHKP